MVMESKVASFLKEENYPQEETSYTAFEASFVNPSTGTYTITFSHQIYFKKMSRFSQKKMNLPRLFGRIFPSVLGGATLMKRIEETVKMINVGISIGRGFVKRDKKASIEKTTGQKIFK